MDTNDIFQVQNSCLNTSRSHPQWSHLHYNTMYKAQRKIIRVPINTYTTVATPTYLTSPLNLTCYGIFLAMKRASFILVRNVLLQLNWGHEKITNKCNFNYECSYTFNPLYDYWYNLLSLNFHPLQWSFCLIKLIPSFVFCKWSMNLHLRVWFSKVGSLLPSDKMTTTVLKSDSKAKVILHKIIFLCCSIFKRKDFASVVLRLVKNRGTSLK